MPERRTSSVTSFMSNLHFSGKVIMASVLFGFGLLLVGAILLIIQTGGQKKPPLRENEEQKKTLSPMTFVGPGVMGVGALFVVVGTVMCLFETRMFRRRKNTDHESLVRSESLPTGNADPTSTKDSKNVEETEVKTVHVSSPKPSETLEKYPLDNSPGEKVFDRQISSSSDRDQSLTFSASVYVDAFDETDNEEQFMSGSVQFSTPPENKSETDIPKACFDGQSDIRRDLSKTPDDPVSKTSDNPVLEASHITIEPTSENLLKENESSVHEASGSSPTEIPTNSDADRDKSMLHHNHNLNSPVQAAQSNNTASEEPHKEGNKDAPSNELLITAEGDSAASDPVKDNPLSPESVDKINA